MLNHLANLSEQLSLAVQMQCWYVRSCELCLHLGVLSRFVCVWVGSCVCGVGVELGVLLVLVLYLEACFSHPIGHFIFYYLFDNKLVSVLKKKKKITSRGHCAGA